MIVIILILILKTFFYLTIYPSLAPIVVMITTGVLDLKIFVFFYIIMLFFFSLSMSVLGMGVDKSLNPEHYKIDPCEYI
jgi:hypothetical protein